MSEFDCENCDRDAIAILKLTENTLYLCQSCYNSAIKEYAERIEDKRLLGSAYDE